MSSFKAKVKMITMEVIMKKRIALLIALCIIFTQVTFAQEIGNKKKEDSELDKTEITTLSLEQTSEVYSVSSSSTWFSQKTPNWNASQLNNLFMPNLAKGDQARTPLHYWNGKYIDPDGGTTMDGGGHIWRWGCVASSVAMILDNMGEKTTNTYTDFRDHSPSYLSPDPFTLIWANTNFTPITYNSTKARYEMLNLTGSSPTNMYVSTAASKFGVTSYRYDVSGQTDQQKHSLLVNLLQLHPEGIAVRMTATGASSGAGHTLVFSGYNGQTLRTLKSNEEVAKEIDSLGITPIKLTPEIEDMYFEAENVASKSYVQLNSIYSLTDFIVCDPATSYASSGSNVPYYQTPWTSKEYPSILNIGYIDVFY